MTAMSLLLTVTAVADLHVEGGKMQRKVTLGITSDFAQGEANEAIADRAFHFFCSMVSPDAAQDLFAMGSRHLVTISPAPAAPIAVAPDADAAPAPVNPAPAPAA